MRLTSKYWIGIKHVGDSKMQPIVKEVTMKEAVQELAAFLVANTLATRIDWHMARTEREIMQRLDPRGGSNAQHVFDDIDSAFAEFDAPTSEAS